LNYARLVWVVGGVVLASILDLVYLFWSRSAAGGRFNQSVWNAAAMGKGHYDIMNVAKHLSYKGKP
jgi:hypothetical protein